MKIETNACMKATSRKTAVQASCHVVQSTTYRFDSTAKMRPLFDMPMECIYSRFANPTCDAVEKKIASLEGGVGAMLTSSVRRHPCCPSSACAHGGRQLHRGFHHLRRHDQPVRRVTLKKLGIGASGRTQRGKRGGSAEAVQAQHQGGVR